MNVLLVGEIFFQDNLEYFCTLQNGNELFLYCCNFVCNNRVLFFHLVPIPSIFRPFWILLLQCLNMLKICLILCYDGSLSCAILTDRKHLSNMPNILDIVDCIYGYCSIRNRVLGNVIFNRALVLICKAF